MNIESIKDNTTWIQGYGACLGKPAGKIVRGDVLGWNSGATSTVKSIVAETPTMVDIETEWEGWDGKKQRSIRRLKKSRIVAIVQDGKFRVANVTKDELRILEHLSNPAQP